jgi:heme exporter protein D
MNWGGWSEFWAMGGYGLYVWGSYAVTLFVMLAELVSLRLRRRSVLRTLRRLARSNTGRGPGARMEKAFNEAET